MLLYIGIISPEASELFPLVEMAKQDLEYSGQFKVHSEHCNLPTSKPEINEILKKGFALACFVGKEKDAQCLEWRLYDTSESEMIKGKKTSFNGENRQDSAHLLARDLWTELMGNEGPFASRLCYVRKTAQGRRKSLSELCIADYNGNNVKVIHKSHQICITPSWSSQQNEPFIIYSEFTRSNVRLITQTLKGMRKVALDFDGTLVGVSFSAHSGDIVYGRSGGIWHYKYDEKARKGSHILLIKEKDACACPSLLANGDIIYCCKGKIKRYNYQTGTRTTLIGDGYNVGPACHEKSHKIVYSKRVRGVMQLFVYDYKNGVVQQITFDKGDKTDPCWSPCGTYVAFCEEHGAKCRVVTLNIKTGKRTFITPADQCCRYPSWSSNFQNMPEAKCDKMVTVIKT